MSVYIFTIGPARVEFMILQIARHSGKKTGGDGILKKGVERGREALAPYSHRVPFPTTPSTTQVKAGRNHLNEEITPVLPIVIGELFSQTISNLGHAALLRRCELPL